MGEKKEVSKEVELSVKEQALRDKEALRLKEVKENTPVQDQLITKAAAATEVRKQARQAFLMAVGGIVLAFLSGIGSSVNLIVGCFIAGVGSIILGWFAVQSRLEIKRLDQTYNL